ncbi:FAD-dependent oxidoreductase [Terasakiella sp.]|uniref:FAD-dependent oxidoreductase n=1 Tax=Terasakiella sp. TaxID=2034861 RepID=UPI003AA8BD5F
MVETIAVLGAGPAGLMAAYELAKAGKTVTLYEKRKVEGGLCGTTVFEGKHGTYRFDFGGHRFITHDPDLLQLVEDLVGDDLLTAYRKSVIRFRGRTYAYPLALGNLLKTAPTALLAGAGLDLATLPFQKPDNTSFATWIESRFGKTLYRNFFEGYTAKLWGIDPKNLSADWASQRISLLDLKDVARRLLPTRDATPRTYAHSYRYPKYGFGVIFEKIAREFERLGGTIRYGTQIDGIECGQDRITAIFANGEKIIADQYLSTISLPDMVRLCGGTSTLKFRGVRFFCMPMETDNISDNTWQYLSDPHIMATRLQEPKRRSPYMAPNGHSSLMLEIPCDPGSDLWTMEDADLFKRACIDLDRLGVPSRQATGEYFSTFGAQAYPLMSVGYEIEREKAIAYLNPFNNLIQCGRQATFRYIFTDTAMEMGQMAARAVLNGQDCRRAIFDHRNERTVIETQSVA